MSCSYDVTRGTRLRDELLGVHREKVEALISCFDRHPPALRKDIELAARSLAACVLTIGASRQDHHSGPGGLFEHSLQVATWTARETDRHFEGADFAYVHELVYLAVLWALLHDIAKRATSPIQCSRCDTPLGPETLEDFLNAHDVPLEAIQYQPDEGWKHEEASSRYYYEWVHGRCSLLSPRTVKLVRLHPFEPQEDLHWIESCVYKLNGRSGYLNRLEVNRNQIIPLLKGTGSPERFPAQPFFYSLVTAVLHRIEHHGLQPKNVRYFLFGEFVAIEFDQGGEDLVTLMKELYHRDHGAMRDRRFKKWSLLYRLDWEAALWAPGRKRNALVKATITPRDGPAFSSRFMLFRRMIDELVVLWDGRKFKGEILFDGPRPAYLAERIVSGDFHSS
jgi:hypothetical protein